MFFFCVNKHRPRKSNHQFLKGWLPTKINTPNQPIDEPPFFKYGFIIIQKEPTFSWIRFFDAWKKFNKKIFYQIGGEQKIDRSYKS